jgi:hypothetical protein
MSSNTTPFTNNSLNAFKLCQGASRNLTRLEEMATHCKTNQTLAKYELYMEYYQIEYTTKFVEDLIILILIPLGCLLGFALNALVIHTIRRNEKSELKPELYKYMSLNSVFNCLYCMAFALYPVNKCNEGGHFCSAIYTTRFAQYDKIV